MHRKILSAQPYMDLYIQNSKKSKLIFIENIPKSWPYLTQPNFSKINLVY